MRARTKSAAAAAEADAAADGGSEEQTQQQRVNTAVGSARRQGLGTAGGGSGAGRQRQKRGQVSEIQDPDAIDLQTWLEQPEATLSEPDEKGLCRVHHAAVRGFIAVLQRAEAFNKQLLELKTSDGLAMSPLLVAVSVSIGLYRWRSLGCMYMCVRARAIFMCRYSAVTLYEGRELTLS